MAAQFAATILIFVLTPLAIQALTKSAPLYGLQGIFIITDSMITSDRNEYDYLTTLLHWLDKGVYGNIVESDIDGVCPKGLVSVYRSYNAAIKDHTFERSMAPSKGYTLEGRGSGRAAFCCHGIENGTYEDMDGTASLALVHYVNTGENPDNAHVVDGGQLEARGYERREVLCYIWPASGNSKTHKSTETVIPAKKKASSDIHIF